LCMHADFPEARQFFRKCLESDFWGILTQVNFINIGIQRPAYGFETEVHVYKLRESGDGRGKKAYFFCSGDRFSNKVDLF
jgi:hypothetical protein